MLNVLIEYRKHSNTYSIYKMYLILISQQIYTISSRNKSVPLLGSGSTL